MSAEASKRMAAAAKQVERLEPRLDAARQELHAAIRKARAEGSHLARARSAADLEALNRVWVPKMGTKTVLSGSQAACLRAIRAPDRLTKALPRPQIGFSGRGYGAVRMSVPASSLLGTSGYLVTDAHGQVVGRVECPMYGTQPEVPDALSVRQGFARRRRLVPADAIDEIDGPSGFVGLNVARDSLRSFL